MIITVHALRDSAEFPALKCIIMAGTLDILNKLQDVCSTTISGFSIKDAFRQIHFHATIGERVMNPVITGATMNCVVPVTTNKNVIAKTTEYEIITTPAINEIGPGVTTDFISIPAPDDVTDAFKIMPPDRG